MVASPLLQSMPVTPTLPPPGIGSLPTMPTPTAVGQPEPNSLDDILNEIDASTKMPLPGQTTPNTPQPNNPFPFPPTNQNSPFPSGPNPYSNYWNQINNPIIDLPSMNFPPMGQLGSNPLLTNMMNNSNMMGGMGPSPNSNLPIIKQEPGLFNTNPPLQSPQSASPMVSPVPPRTAPAPTQVTPPQAQLRPETSLIAETLKKADKKRRKSSSSQKLPSASLTPPTPAPEQVAGRSRRPSLTQNSSLAALLKSATPPTLPSSSVTPLTQKPSSSGTTSGRDHVNSLFNPTASSSPTLQTSTMFQDLIKKILKQQQQKPSTPKEIQEQAQLILQNANFSRNQLSDLASLGNLTKPAATPTPPPVPTPSATPGGHSAATSTLSGLLQSSNSNLDKHRQLFGGLELLFQNQSPDTAAVAKAAAAATKTQKQNQTKEENQSSAPQGLDAARDLLRKIKSIRETSGLIDAPPSISLSGSTSSSSGGSAIKRERKASVTKAEPKVTKKLKIDTTAPPREPETKIVHSPNVTEVTTLETPSGTLILTPTKAAAKAVAKKRKLPTGEPSRGLKSPKRVRNSSRSPVRAQQSGSYQRPSRKSLPPAAYRGKLPQIKLTRKNGQKWTISDYIFPTTVPDSELDCTKIIEKAVQRRQRRKSGKRAPSAQKTPPPLQRAPQEGPAPSGSAVKQLPILSPAPATSPACTVAVISPPPLTPSTPGAPTQSVTTTPQSVESNNPPVTESLPSLKIKIKLSKNNNPPPTTTSSGGGGVVRSTPRKAKREVKYTVDQWWDEDTL